MLSPQVTDPELVVCDNITGVACSADGRHVLANYLNNHVYLFAIDGVGLGAAPAAEASPASSPGRARRDIAAQGAALASLPRLRWSRKFVHDKPSSQGMHRYIKQKLARPDHAQIGRKQHIRASSCPVSPLCALMQRRHGRQPASCRALQRRRMAARGPRDGRASLRGATGARWPSTSAIGLQPCAAATSWGCASQASSSPR